ncbi:MAG: proline--tRNA ligase, partial [Proteobacteria bacterium]|nr:proline--tRNA ligase [Pseudomonadota bacterium]
FIQQAANILDEMQQKLYQKALKFQQDHTHFFDQLADFKNFFADESANGFAVVYSSDDPSIEPLLKEYKISARCIPLSTIEERGTCIFTGKANAKKTIYAKAY